MSPDHLKRARDLIARKKQQEQERGPKQRPLQRPPLAEVSPNGRHGERHDEAQKVYETIPPHGSSVGPTSPRRTRSLLRVTT